MTAARLHDAAAAFAASGWGKPVILLALGLIVWGCLLPWAIRVRRDRKARLERRPGGYVPWQELVRYPELDRHAAHKASEVTEQWQACNRCRTGSAAFPCTCERDCYAFACHCQGGRRG